MEEVSGRVEVGTSPKEEERGEKWDTSQGVQLHVLLLLGSVVVHKTRQMAINCHLQLRNQSIFFFFYLCFAISLYLSFAFFLWKKKPWIQQTLSTIYSISYI